MARANARGATTPETIALDLRREIVAGDLVPGTDLIQNELAERFAASRIPVREALRLLEAEGLVTIQANRGAQVTSLSADEVAEIFHLRLLLEPDCLSAAVPKMTAADLDEIDRARRRGDIDAGTADWSDSDWRFHDALYRPSGRLRQIELIRTLRLTSRLYARAHATLPDRTSDWLHDHASIVAHCRKGQVEQAVKALTNHLRASAAHVQRAMTPVSRK